MVSLFLLRDGTRLWCVTDRYRSVTQLRLTEGEQEEPDDEEEEADMDEEEVLE